MPAKNKVCPECLGDLELRVKTDSDDRIESKYYKCLSCRYDQRRSFQAPLTKSKVQE
jgi:transposase-like protein